MCARPLSWRRCIWGAAGARRPFVAWLNGKRRVFDCATEGIGIRKTIEAMVVFVCTTKFYVMPNLESLHLNLKGIRPGRQAERPSGRPRTSDRPTARPLDRPSDCPAIRAADDPTHRPIDRVADRTIVRRSTVDRHPGRPT